jgi:hypothetical protein
LNLVDGAGHLQVLDERVVVGKAAHSVVQHVARKVAASTPACFFKVTNVKFQRPVFLPLDPVIRVARLGDFCLLDDGLPWVVFVKITEAGHITGLLFPR